MRNLKKILALVLALVMSFSIMTVSSADFKDQADVDETYAEAIDVLSALNVFRGYENGKFDPKGTITRAEVAAIIYRVTTGDVEDVHVDSYAEYNVFSDVKAGSWYAGYVNYCANAKYVQGRGNGTFDPNAKVTGYEALAMILRAIGYDKNQEFTGAGYAMEVARIANRRGITNNIKVSLSADATREMVAEILFRTITIPQVVYDLRHYDYITSHDGVWNDSLAYDNFELVRIEGVISAIDREANETDINNANIIFSVDDDFNHPEMPDNTVASVTLKGTEISWEKIGYNAYFYATETNKARIYDALTDAYYIGTNEGESHDGTSFATLINEKDGIVMDTWFDVYVNGYYQASYNTASVRNDAKIMNATSFAFYYPELAKADEIGVKFEFVDNDNGGKVDAVLITEYTLATVTGVATDINAGINATKNQHYYFDVVTSFHKDDIVYDSTLVKGQYVTFVVYDGEAYITETATTTGAFVSMTQEVVNADFDKEYVYGVGSEEHMKSFEYGNAYGVEDVMFKANLGATVVAYLDHFGYLLFAEIPVNEASYLYVYENEQTKGLGVNKTTETIVVYTDGTVETVLVGSVDGYNFFWNTADDTTWGDGLNDCIRPGVYTYSVANGVYTLRSAKLAEVNAAAYTAGKAQFGDENGLNNASKLIDVRRGKVTDKATVYVGHTGADQVPTLLGVKTLSVVYPNGIIKWGFLTEGTAPSAGAPGVDYSNEFIVYNTGYNKLDVTSGGYVYYMDVIQNGVVVKNFELSETEYNYIDTYGVGHYIIDKAGNLKFITFPEGSDGNGWLDINWSGNTLILGDGKFVEYGEVPFQVLNIGEGTAHAYKMTEGEDLAWVKAYVTYDAKTGAVSAIYLIADIANLADQYDEYAHLNGVNYFVADGEITNIVEDVTLDALMTALVEAEDARYALAVATAELNAYLASTAATKAAKTLNDLYKAVEDAQAALVEAVVALNAAVQAAGVEVTFPCVAEVKAVVEATIAVTATKATEVVEAAEAVIETVVNALAETNVAATVEKLDVVYDVKADATVNAAVVAKVTGEALKAVAASKDAALVAAIAEGAIITVEAVAEINELGVYADAEFSIVLTLGNEKTVIGTVTVTTLTVTDEAVEEA